MTEAVNGAPARRYDATLYELLSAYAQQRQRNILASVRMPGRTIWTLAEAREILERILGPTTDWTPLDSFLSDYLDRPGARATVRASSLSASLELAKEGKLDLRQDRPYAPVFLRARPADPER